MESGHIHNTQRRSAFAKRMTAYRFCAVIAVLFVSLMAFSSSAFAESYTFNYSTRGSGSITDGPNSGAWSETVLGSGPGDVDGAVPGLDLNPAPADCFPTVTQTADPDWTFSHWEIISGGSVVSTSTDAAFDCALIGHPISGTTTYDIVAAFVPDIEFSGLDRQAGEGFNIQFTVTPTGAYPEAITVTYNIVGKGVAPDAADPVSNGSDLAAYTGSFTIPASQASYLLSIGTKNDALVEANEEFTITLTGVTSVSSGHQNAYLGTDVAATGRIMDNDALTVEFNQATGNDAESSGGNLPRFLVTGDVATAHSVSVDVTIGAGTATGGGVDYDNPTTLTVNAGTYAASSQAIPSLAIQGDSIVEANETILLSIDTSPADVTAGAQGSTTYTINDDDALTVDFFQAAGADDENDPAPDLPEFVVDGSVGDGHSVTIDVTVDAGSSATGGGVDYSDPTTLTIVGPVTHNNARIAIPSLAITGETLLEADETFILNVDTSPSDVTGGGTLATTYTIRNDDTATATLAAGTVGAENNAPGTPTDATFTVTLDKQNDTGSAITVDYTFTGGTATGGGIDYTSATTSVDIAAGTNSGTITVPVVEDALLEATETLQVTLTAATSNADVTANTTPVIQNITSDDTATATLAVDSAGTEGTTDATYTVSLDKTNNTGSAITVDYTFTNGTAIGGGTDFTSSTTSVDVLDGNNQATITVPVIDDAFLEAVETFNVTLTAATSNGQVTGDTTAQTNSITSDDTGTATLAAGVAGAENGAGAVTDATYTVTLDKQNDTGSAITVTYAFSGGTATGGGTDYDSSTTTVDVLNGQSNATITVPVVEDTLLEATETFNVTLAAATSNGQVTGDTTAQTNSITSDDTATATLAAGVAGAENGAGAVTDATYTVSLDKQNDTGSAITVTYAFSDGTATGGGTDYDTSTTTVDVLNGQSNATITVPVVEDTLLEATETFNVTLAAATSNGQVTGDTTAQTNSITSDDTATVSVAKTQDAAEPGTSATFLVTMTSTNNTGSAITIPYSFTDGSAGGADYDKSGTNITIADAANTAVITVPVFDDTLLEATETYSLTVADSSDNAQVTASGTVTDIANITSEDTATATLAAGVAGAENGAGVVTDATYTVSLDKQNDTGSTITVTYAFTDGTATGGGTDYDSSTTTVDVLNGQSNATITVPVVEDTLLEATETFNVTLAAATSNGQVTGDTTAQTNSITSDDTATVSVAKTQDAAEPGTSATFLVTMTSTNNTGSAITIPYSFTDGSAGGGDYDKSGTSITIADAASTAVITVPVFDDTLLEATETYSLTVADSSDNAQVTASGTVTQIANITSEDTATVRLTANTAGAENNAPGSPTAATFTVTMDSANYTGSDITVNYSFASGSAVGGTDFNNAGSSVAIADGSATAVISVPVLEDALLESTETFSVTLTGTDNGQVAVASDGTQTRETTITSDDTATATLAAGVPGAEPATAATFTVSLDKQNDTGSDITVTYAFTDGTATGGGVDYTSSTTTVDVLAGQSNATITVPVNDDALLEATETFNVTLAAATSNAQVTGDTTPVTNSITSDETATVSVSTIQGAAEPATPAAFLVTMTTTNNTGSPITIPYSFTDGSATGGADFDNSGANITIGDGTSSAVITVPVTDDALLETTETFSLTIADSSDNAQVTASGTVTDVANITSEDTATATLAAGVVGAENGAGAVTDATYTVTLDKTNNTGSTITVTYAFTDGTATGGGTDYDSSTTTVDVLDGQSNATITVPVVEDTLLEATETFNVTLAAATTNAQVTGDTTAVTNNITSDDTATVSVAKTTDAAEPGTPATFTVTMTTTNNTGNVITIPYSFTNGTATGGADFDNLGANITIADSAATAVITVPVTDDALLETTETFSLTIADSSDMAQVTAFGTVTDTASITSEDTATVNLTANTVGTENGAGATTPATFTVTMNKTNDTGSNITVNYSFTDGSAIGGTDYNNGGSSVVITTGGNTATITVPVLEDVIVEGSETFSATVTGTDNGQVTAASDGSQTRLNSITDDDSTTVSISATDPTASEPGDNGEFTITLGGGKVAPAGGITVTYAINGATTATSVTDYAALPGTATIAAAASSATIPVIVVNDAIVEGDETLIIDLVSTDHVGVGIAASPNDSDAVTISDEDSATFSINDAIPSNEDQIGTGTRTFFVTLTGEVDQSVTIDFSTADGSATVVDNDYVSNTNTLTFAGTFGEIIQVDITTNGDYKVEADETFAVNLSNVNANGKNVTIADNQGIGTLLNDDFAKLTIADVSDNEDNGSLTFTVELDNDVQGGVAVDYDTSDDTAQTGDFDYGNTSGTLNFAGTAGQQLSIVVGVVPDTKVEADESFLVTLSNVVHTVAGGFVTLEGNPATGIIQNDDTATLNISNQSKAEDDASPLITFTVTLSAPVQGGVSVDYTTGDGSAETGDTDYGFIGGTHNFPGTFPAASTFDIVVPITDDNKIEADETFSVTLSNIVHSAEPGQITTVGSPATGTIINDDAMALSISDVVSVEGSGGGFNSYVFQVDSPLEVQDGYKLAFTVNDLSATDADDFDVITTSPLTFGGSVNEKQFITVDVIKDNVSEDDETFSITLGPLSEIPATAADDINTADVGYGTLVYDDYEAFMGADVTEDEGDLTADNVNLTFTVNLDRPNKSGGDIDLEVTTTDDTAIATNDYSPLSSLVVSIPDTETSETFNVAVIEDEVVENDEAFFADITGAPANPAAYTSIRALPNSRSVGTIRNDDQATLAIDDVIANEGADGSTTTFTFTVTLTGDVDQAFTVDWATADSSAVSDADFLSANGTLNFTGTDTESYPIDITVNGDDEVEYDETFFVNLSNIAAGGKNVIFSDAQGAGSILNDNKYRVTVDDVSTDEPDAAGTGQDTPAVFTISLHQAVLGGQSVVVNYTTSGTPTSGPLQLPVGSPGSDYTATAGSETFNPTDITKTVTVDVLDEAVDVDTEYYYLNISAGSINAQIDDSTGVGTIVDNEYEVTASVDATNNQGSICRGGASPDCDDPIGAPPGGPITEIIERDQTSSPYTITANSGYCIGDVQRNGTSVLGGTVPISPYAYTAINIQDDPTTIEASFRSELNFTTNIEPVEARTYGQWRLRDTSKTTTPFYYVLPVGHPLADGALSTILGYPATAVADNAWLDHGDTVVIPCDKAGYDLEYKEVSGWFTPATVSYSIPPAAGSNFTATGTYVSKTVTLTLATSAGTGTETIDVEPVGSGEAGPNTHTYKLVDNVTVSLTANAAILPAPGSIFLSWTGPVADPFSSTTTVVMDQDRTVTANFGLPGVDNDGDGYDAGPDCNDSDPTIHPDAPELCGDGIDQDCTGGDPVCVGPDADDDGDGYTENQGDCDDTNAAINPGATEICGNAIDEDCYDGPRDCGTEVICSDYAERPLETQAAAAAPMVMFVLDDSGSMDWSMMTEEGDGLFDGERYVWNIGDNQYSQVLSASERREWRSQYAAYNKMYYNPATDYVPWPDWNTADDTEGTTGTKIKDGGTAPPIDADSDNPRSNPVRDDWTLNMDATFFSVLPATTVTQWITVERHGGSSGNSTLADAVKLVGTGYAGDPDTFQSDAGTLANNNLIVDNEPDQTDHTFTENGNWNTSGSPNPWDENARYTTGNNSATWRFSVPITGTYDVYARWNEYNQRDQNARYAVTYNNGGTTTNYSANQRLNGNSWVQLATGLPFTIQDNSSGATINVKNAHYFIWVDHDGDGTMEYQAAHGVNATNSEVYLVNVPGSAGTYTLDFYRFVDASDNAVVNDGELFLLTAADTYWNDIQPRNEGGTLRTAAEERQNIANWWSFYRRRELTAKAAIGRTISGTEGMHIGIMGINARIEEELVPIGVESTQIKTLDNQDASYSDTGTWSESGSPNEFNGSSFFTSNSGNTARWTPTFTAGEAGTYRVYAWWNCFSNRDSNAKYTVVDKDGSTDYFKDQRSGQTNSQCGQWVLLGVHGFDETGSQYVEVARHAGSTGSSTNADAVRFESTGAKVTVNQTSYILNELYQVNSSGGTPLRRGLQNAGKYFDNEDSGATGGLNATPPWASAADGGGCQRAFAIVMTDGYYNGSNPSPSVGNEDSDGNRPLGTNADGIGSSTFDSSFYAGTGSNTLSDVAMYYYEKDLHGGLANDVPPVNYDLADHQHMVTYGVSFGVKGTLDPTAYPNCLPDTPPTETTATCPSWPNPNSNARKIDDLYHASVSGRGKYLNAANPGELVSALKEIIEDVADKTGTGSSVSINAQELKEGTLLFQASYLTGSWRGDLAAKTLNALTGEIETTLWSAAEQLFTKTHDTRKIVTYNGTVGKHFRYDTTTYTSELTDAQIKKLLNLAEARDLSVDVLTAAEQTALEKLVDYLRGDATYEGTSGGTFRQRARKDGTTDIGVLGDIVHSAPLHVGEVVYVGGNDGMLHAFDDTTGEELWAYVPSLIYDDLDELSSQSYQHNFYVDNSPFSQVIKDSGGNASTLLTGTLGRGGKGVYALNISSPKPATEADARTLARWEYPSATQPTASPGSDDDLGFGFGRAFIVNSHLDDGASDTRYVVIMGNGYQSANGEAMLYVLDAHTGALLGKIETDVGTPVLCNGLSVPVLIDPDFDGIADFAYAGDLLGNMWKFDLRGDSISDWKVAHNTNADGTSGTPQPMFQAKNKQGHRQPITTKADVMAHPDAKLGGYMVIFGTGRYLGNADFGENSTQTIYGIWDWQPTWEAAGISSPDKYLGAFGPVTGTPEFGRLNYINKPAGSDFIIGQTVTGASSTATGVIEEIVEDSVRLDYINKPTATDFVVGQTVTGGTSSATGVIDVIAETDDNSGYLILTNLSATSAFSAGELITSLTVTSNAEVATVAGSSSGSLKLKTLSATAFVIGEAITTATVSSDAVVANEVIPIAFRPLTNIASHAALAGVGQFISLLEQNQIAFLQQSRFMSNHPAFWFNPSSDSSGRLEHAGWYFDLPGNNEKMIRDPLIRNGIAFVISSIPSSSPCASGGASIIHALDGATGGRSLTAVFDISGPEGVPDGKIDEHDLVNIGTPDNPRYVAPTGLMRDAMWYTPAVLAVQDAETDVMYFSTSEGDVQLMKVEAEKTGVYYWREIP